jgi:Na+-transporting NADH:ubiquinone oxidoreductase subunit NqrC
MRFSLVLSLLLSCTIQAQLKPIQSEQLLPKDAVTVFSINNISLLQKISMDDLVNYEFMSEVHQELFDGSTSGKTLKDANASIYFTAAPTPMNSRALLLASQIKKRCLRFLTIFSNCRVRSKV